eukprot:CAMPEP_0194539770 /NCGR_PEP_ID=MMETSP0253-20130528/79807_1 /TAXON_ID=2966 /ORGANISM="Noctiluca scintillans" /LENGTH=59 /DNA_ID=CAMNT_0039386079 /DNA_START=41 /DNA_END=217 /DNA_ORIENTATION=-
MSGTPAARTPSRPPLADFWMSGIAAVCAIVFTNPVDVVKTRLQLQGEAGGVGGKYCGVA